MTLNKAMLTQFQIIILLSLSTLNSCHSSDESVSKVVDEGVSKVVDTTVMCEKLCRAVNTCGYQVGLSPQGEYVDCVGEFCDCMGESCLEDTRSVQPLAPISYLSEGDECVMQCLDVTNQSYQTSPACQEAHVERNECAFGQLEQCLSIRDVFDQCSELFSSEQELACHSANIVNTPVFVVDDTLPQLNQFFVSGACRARDQENNLSPNMLDLSVILVHQTTTTAQNITPTTRVENNGGRQIYESMGCETPWSPMTECQTQPIDFSSSNFEFRQHGEMTRLIDEQVLEEGNAYIEAYGENDSGELTYYSPTTVDLSPVSLEYQWSSQVPSEAETRVPLLIVLLDQSTTNIGLGGLSDISLASDGRYAHQNFFKVLIGNLDPNHEVALINFAGSTSSFETDNSMDQPSTNRDMIKDQIDRLSNSQAHDNGTPLKLALHDARRLIEQVQGTKAYDPVVIIYTDGVENGDSSPDTVPSLAETGAWFASENIPVHTLQLRAQVDVELEPAEGEQRRAPITELSELACLTGGDFFYLHDADQFISNDHLEPMLRNRLPGRWRLTIQSDNLFSVMGQSDALGFMLASQLQATLANQVRIFDLWSEQKFSSQNGETIEINNRAWLLNE